MTVQLLRVWGLHALQAMCHTVWLPPVASRLSCPSVRYMLLHHMAGRLMPCRVPGSWLFQLWGLCCASLGREQAVERETPVVTAGKQWEEQRPD